MMVRNKDSRKRKQGMLTIEFAAMLPFLLVLFLFAWDVIFYFNYQILGSYAVFAASRSYAVLQKEDIARDVATAIMSTATAPTGEELKTPVNGTAARGVDKFLSSWNSLSGNTNSVAQGHLPLPFAVARRRITEFKVVEEELEGFELRKGYTYEGFTGGGGSSGTWFDNLLRNLGFKADPEVLTPARVVHITMHYDYPILMGYLRKPSFVMSRGVDNMPAAFTIYSSCASPIQPISAAAQELEEIDSGELELADYQMEALRKKDLKVKEALRNFYDYIVDVHARFIDTAALDDAAGYNWLIVAASTVGSPIGARYSDSESQAVSVPWIYGAEAWLSRFISLDARQTHMRRKAFDPLTDNFYPLSAIPGFSEKLESEYLVEGLFHPRLTLDFDIKYRQHVIRKIGEEVSALRADQGRLQNAQATLNTFLRTSKTIRMPVGEDSYEEIDNPRRQELIDEAESYINSVDPANRTAYRSGGIATPSNSEDEAKTTLGHISDALGDITERLKDWKERESTQNTWLEASEKQRKEGFGEGGWNEAIEIITTGLAHLFSGVTGVAIPDNLNNQMDYVRAALRAYYTLARDTGNNVTKGMGDLMEMARDRTE